jgi:hypothetical protein
MLSEQSLGYLPLKVVCRRRPIAQNKNVHVCLAVNSITMTKTSDTHSNFNGQRLKQSLPLEGECGGVTG